MISEIYVEDWFRDTRYSTLFFVYAAGYESAWGGITKTHRVAVRIRNSGSLSSVTVLPATITTAAIRSWYGPVSELNLADAKTGVWWADRVVRDLFPDAEFRSSSGALVAMRY